MTPSALEEVRGLVQPIGVHQPFHGAWVRLQQISKALEPVFRFALCLAPGDLLGGGGAHRLLLEGVVAHLVDFCFQGLLGMDVLHRFQCLSFRVLPRLVQRLRTVDLVVRKSPCQYRRRASGDRRGIDAETWNILSRNR